jgi:hypothetical protein
MEVGVFLLSGVHLFGFSIEFCTRNLNRRFALPKWSVLG